MKFEGILTALVTPMTDHFQVDEEKPSVSRHPN